MNWKIIFATIVIFGAGVMAGGLVVSHAQRPHHGFNRPPSQPAEMHAGPSVTNQNQSPRWIDFPKPRLPEVLKKEFVEHLNDSLQLSPEQREKIGKIISDGQEKNHAIWTNVAPEIREVIQDVNRQIREQLTAEQQKEFEQLLRQARPPWRPMPTNLPPVNPVPPTNSPAAALTKSCA